jgi:2-iminobutanoate/2-iminopropanoate deaminase
MTLFKTATTGVLVLVLSGVAFMQQQRDAVAAGGFVFMSGLTGSDAAGDVTAATRGVLTRMRDVLGKAGSSLPQVLNVTVYLKQAGDFDAMNTAYREFFTSDLPARTTVVTDLPSGVLVQISAVAAPQGTPREVLHPAGWMKSPRPYSYIVRSGQLVFLAGLVSRRGSDDQVVPGPVALQTRTILDNAGQLLRAAGLDYSDVVAARVFLTDDSMFETMNDEYRTYFADLPPARATAIVGLMGADAQVEISLIASTDGKVSLGPTIAPTLPVSAAVRAGHLLFLSGAMGNTAANRDDAAAQARETFGHLKQTLALAGASFADVVDSTVYLPNVHDAAKVDAVFNEIFPTAPPARTLAGAKLSTRDAAVEILITAVK